MGSQHEAQIPKTKSFPELFICLLSIVSPYEVYAIHGSAPPPERQAITRKATPRISTYMREDKPYIRRDCCRLVFMYQVIKFTIYLAGMSGYIDLTEGIPGALLPLGPTALRLRRAMRPRWQHPNIAHLSSYVPPDSLLSPPRRKKRKRSSKKKKKSKKKEVLLSKKKRKILQSMR